MLSVRLKQQVQEVTIWNLVDSQTLFFCKKGFFFLLKYGKFSFVLRHGKHVNSHVPGEKVSRCIYGRFFNT
jgi:hypothetical protein